VVAATRGNVLRCTPDVGPAQAGVSVPKHLELRAVYQSMGQPNNWKLLRYDVGHADGADVGAVAARAGHANAGTTLGIYTHAVPGKSDLSDQWEKLQGKKSAPVKTQ